MNEEQRVEELEREGGVAEAEQSAAWREVAREAVRNATQLGWAFWAYLLLRLGYELIVRWML